MAPTSCFTGQVHRLPDAPEAYGAMITRAKAAPPQSRSTDLTLLLAESQAEQAPIVILVCKADWQYNGGKIHALDIRQVVTVQSN